MLLASTLKTRGWHEDAEIFAIAVLAMEKAERKTRDAFNHKRYLESDAQK